MQRILIVDDSAAMRSMIVSALEELDLPVKFSEAASGFEALRLLPQQPFDLVVTDINMPDINGLELVSFVRRDPRFQSTPVLIVTTEGSERDRDKGMELGADAYLVKPFAPADLCDVVHGLLKSDREEG